MATIVTRAGKGSPLTFAEVDANFTNLNNDKLELSGGNAGATLATATGSTTARTLANRFADVVNVKDFGAVGDGVTDDTAAIQAAINASLEKRLFWPAGVYSVTALTVSSATTHWQGEGAGETIIRKRGTTPGNLVEVVFSSKFSIKDIQFDGGDVSDSFPYASLNLTFAEDFVVENCRFIKFDKLGLVINGGQFGYINNNYFLRTTASFQGANQSISIGVSAGPSNNITVSNNSCINSGIFSVGPHNSFINNYVVDWKYGAGISTSTDGASDFNLIAGNYLSSGTGLDSDGFDLKGIEAWGRYGKIIGNTCVSCSGSGIFLGGQFSIVSGNLCLDNGTYGEPTVSGIIAFYLNANNNAKYSVISGNICWDSAGSGGTQKYGIAADYRLNELHIVDNQAYQNKVASYWVYNGLSDDQTTSITFRGRTYTLSFTWDATSISDGATLTNAQTVTGARLGDFVQASCNISQAGLTLSAYVNAADTVTVVLTNNTGGSVDLSSATFRIFGQKAFF
jgi:hypothetical protein